MLTLTNHFGTASSILEEARRIADLTDHSVEFVFNGVKVNVGVNYMGRPDPHTDVSRILDAVRNQQTDTLYL